MVRTGASAYVSYGFEDTYGAGASAITNSFGRQLELSADKLAVQYIKKTGLTKAGYVKFLYWMKENLNDSDRSSATSIFSTHPATQERINQLMKN